MEISDDDEAIAAALQLLIGDRSQQGRVEVLRRAFPGLIIYVPLGEPNWKSLVKRLSDDPT